MRTNFERNLEDSVDRVKNSVACNDVEKNNECAPFLGLHLQRVGNWSNKENMPKRWYYLKRKTNKNVKINKQIDQTLTINTSRKMGQTQTNKLVVRST